MADDGFSEDDIIQLALLRDEETDALIDAGLLDSDQRMASPLDQELCFAFEELVLHVNAGSRYPVSTPEQFIVNHTLSRLDVDHLRNRLRHIVEKSRDTNCLEKWIDRENTVFGIFEPTMVVLEMAKETRAWIDAIRSRNVDEEVENDPWSIKKPVAALSSNEMAFRYLGKTAKEICDTIPASYRVLHVECVIRRNLAARFEECQDKLRRNLVELKSSLNQFVPRHMHRATKADKAAFLARPRMTFHGTQRHYIPSIVQYGFLKPGARRPGTAEEHAVRCGSTYGRGIYSSPSAEFSLSYANWYGGRTKPNEFFGLKLLVCAVVMGRAREMFREDDWRAQDEAYEGADSHVANRQLEYVVFDPAQILPVYVVHLDWGANNAAHFYDVPDDPAQWTPVANNRPNTSLDVNQGLHSQYAGERQRAKQAVFAKAAKYFPYGYGPATGTRFVVEEVGDVSEDEEDYGDYQALRVEENKADAASGQTDFWSWIKAAEEEGEGEQGTVPRVKVDEYTQYVNWYRPLNWDGIETPDQKKMSTRIDDDDSYNLDILHIAE